MTDDSTHTFHNTNTVKNILTLSSVKTPSDPWGKELQGQQAGKEGLVLFLNPHQFPVSQPFWFFAVWGRNRMLGQPFITSRWKMKNLLLLFSPLLRSEALLPQSIPFSLPLLPLRAQGSLTTCNPGLSLASCLWGQKHRGGDKNTGVGTARGSNMSQCFSESGERRIWL